MFLKKERKLASEESSKEIHSLALGLEKEVNKLKRCEINPDYNKARKAVKILDDIKKITSAALKKSEDRVKYEYI